MKPSMFDYELEDPEGPGPFMYDDRVFTQHVFNHYDERPPEVNFEVAETTRGATTKVEMKYVHLGNFKEAIELYEKVMAIIKGEPEQEEKDEDQVEA